MSEEEVTERGEPRQQNTDPRYPEQPERLVRTLTEAQPYVLLSFGPGAPATGPD